jgi:predicted SnoaL-like aldol condensation-catalyzing enzyme
MMKKYSLLLASLMLMTILSACTGNSSQPPATTTPETTENSGNTAPGNEASTSEGLPTAEEAQIIANKQLVTGLYNDVFNGHQLDKVNQYLAENYTEHNPDMESGRDQFSSFYEGVFKQHPDYKSDITGMIGQGNLVAVFSSGKAEPVSTNPAASTSAEASSSEATTDATSTATAGTNSSDAKTAIYVDIYRISDKQIAEHWVVQQNANDTATLFTPDKLPALSTKAELASTDRATVAANTSFVDSFFNTFFVQHNTDIANEAVSENVEQYGSGIQNGRSALVSHYLTDFRANTDSKATRVNTIAEGNLVLVHSHMQSNANDRGQAVIQLFRIDNGQIAAMWTISEPVPESGNKATTMF